MPAPSRHARGERLSLPAGRFQPRRDPGLLATAGQPGWKSLVEAKLGDVRHRIGVLTEIDRGLEHALLCPSENVLRCQHFRAELTAAPPIDPNNRVRHRLAKVT